MNTTSHWEWTLHPRRTWLTDRRTDGYGVPPASHRGLCNSSRVAGADSSSVPAPSPTPDCRPLKAANLLCLLVPHLLNLSHLSVNGCELSARAQTCKRRGLALMLPHRLRSSSSPRYWLQSRVRKSLSFSPTISGEIS